MGQGGGRRTTLATPCSLPAHVERRERPDEIRDLDSGHTPDVRHRPRGLANDQTHAQSCTHGPKATSYEHMEEPM